jgi:hypothetical protein
MRIDPSFIQCECRAHVLVINDAGNFTCTNPQCKNFEKVFKPVEIAAQPTGKTYRETLIPESVRPVAENFTEPVRPPVNERRRK